MSDRSVCFWKVATVLTLLGLIFTNIIITYQLWCVVDIWDASSVRLSFGDHQAVGSNVSAGDGLPSTPCSSPISCPHRSPSPCQSSCLQLRRECTSPVTSVLQAGCVQPQGSHYFLACRENRSWRTQPQSDTNMQKRCMFSVKIRLVCLASAWNELTYTYVQRWMRNEEDDDGDDAQKSCSISVAYRTMSDTPQYSALVPCLMAVDLGLNFACKQTQKVSKSSLQSEKR